MFCPRCANEVPETSKLCPSCGMDIAAITEITRGKSNDQPEDIDLVKDALGDEYEIVSELGRGGMAVVYKAIDRNLEREVAVKVLPLSMAYDNEFVQRFQREAKTAAQLEHPNVIPIYRVGKTGRIIYFVMKYLRGKSLGDIVDEKGPLPPEDIRRILAEAADALGYAHESGVVHRDIKPDNIVFDEKGRSIVTDFGIAKAATGTRLTGTGMAIGTPYYMSPEQARAQDLDGRSDIYSLGVVAYQCLTGSVPFEGDDSFAVGIKHISAELPIPELETDAQRELFVIIQKMLEKKPEDRFQTTPELITALRGGVATTAATQAMAASDPAFPPISATTPTTPLPSAAVTTAAPAPKKKISVPVLAAIAGVVIIVGGGAVIMANGGDDSGNETGEPIASVAGADSTNAQNGNGAQNPDGSGNANGAANDNSADADNGDAAVDATRDVSGGGDEGDAQAARRADNGNGTGDAAPTGRADANSGADARQNTSSGNNRNRGATPSDGGDAQRDGRQSGRADDANARPETPANPPGPTPAERRWQREVTRRMGVLANQAADQGFEPVGNPILGRLADNGQRDHTITLSGGRQYAIIGFCDDDCTDVDLFVYDSRDTQLDSDVATDAQPVVQVRVRDTAQYRVRVTMPTCNASGCRYAFRVFAAGETRRRRK